MKTKYVFLFLLILFTLYSCNEDTRTKQAINPANFDKMVDGKQVALYTLKNANGLISEITNYGGKVVSLWVPDRNGDFADIVLGHDNIDNFQTATEKYFGATIGRYGNRIAKGKFTLDSVEYTLATNNDPNHLHGGDKGFDAVVWDAVQKDDQTLELTYRSAHMEEGYPGNLDVKVQYQLTDENELKIEYWAATDQATVVNLTHHSFFNLHGAGEGTINDHLLKINAGNYTPVDATLIPTGEIASVEGTPFDFRELTAIGDRVEEDHEQIQFGNGYDHNFVLNQSKAIIAHAAKVVEPRSGRTMDIYTNEPGLQFYGGNFLDGTIVGKNGKNYPFRSAFCLESQHFPDSPNQPSFPTTRLDPGREYYSLCIYKFSISE